VVANQRIRGEQWRTIFSDRPVPGIEGGSKRQPDIINQLHLFSGALALSVLCCGVKTVVSYGAMIMSARSASGAMSGGVTG
jgi:hypothetical protein